MNRYLIKAQKSRESRIYSFVVEASSWESAGRKAERANPVVTSVTRIACGCSRSCDCI